MKPVLRVPKGDMYHITDKYISNGHWLLCKDTLFKIQEILIIIIYYPN